MEFHYFCFALLLAFATESATALECYTCDTPGEQGLVPNCADPFNEEGITKTTCTAGTQCFARLTSGTIPGQQGQPDQEFMQYSRGCLEDETCLPGCFDSPADEASGSPGGNICTYCCPEGLCNGVDIKVTAEEQGPPPVDGSRKCYKCEQPTSEATEGSCASNDFNGEGADQEDCDFKCLATTVTDDSGVPTFRRGCDDQGMFCNLPMATGCCTEELCNVGSEAEGDEPDDDDDDVKPIQCWKCDNSTADTCDMEDMLSEDSANVSKIDCPTGKCISFNNVSPTGAVLTRDCVPPQMESMGVCEEDYKSDTFKDIKCCEKDLCNHAASLVHTSFAIIIGTLFISMYFTNM